MHTLCFLKRFEASAGAVDTGTLILISIIHCCRYTDNEDHDDDDDYADDDEVN